MELNHQVDPNNTKGESEPLPAGEYVMAVVESDIKQTKDGTGAYVYLVLEVVEGEFKGRKAWDRINRWNANEKTVEMAIRTLNQIGLACGLTYLKNTQDLHYKPMLVRLGFKPADGQFDASNTVKSYKPLERAPQASLPSASPVPASQAFAQPPQQAAPATSAQRPPWGARR